MYADVKLASYVHQASNSYSEVKEMDKLYRDLEEVKVEIEKLREECRAKTELSDSLRKAHAEQLAKIQQEKLDVDKLAEELNAKSVEICEIRHMYKELQSSLCSKDLFLQKISSANEKLRAEYSEKISKLEGKNRDLALALEEASVRIQDLEKKTFASSEEIAGLKRHLSIIPEKNIEVQKNALKDLKERDEYILRLEEECKITKDQLKWKNEQFSHLEEAHGRLQNQFEVSRVEWQKEKFSLIGEISSLQAALDSQVRISESLETQLRTTNQALAHEESRRKVLEIEVSESRSRFENVFRDCEEAKSEIEQLTTKRDEEIAELRMLLRKKEILANEMKYQTAQLEQENGDLLMSLKDTQEVQINNNATSSLKKLQNKHRGSEELHSKRAVNLEEEGEWTSQVEKVTREIKCYLSELGGKNKSIGELHKTLEDCQCLLEVKNEEILAVFMVLKSQFYVAYSKLDAKEKLEMGIMQIEEKNRFLNQQLQSKNTELDKLLAELKQRCDEIAVLVERDESLDSLKQKDNLIEEELKRYKAMLDESKECQCKLKQQLANRTSEVEQSKLELQKSKSEMGILKLNLEENQQAHNQENASLLVILKDKDAEIGKLQEKICELESVVLAKSEAAEMLTQEKYSYKQLAEDRNCSIIRLQNEIAQLKNEFAEREAGNSALLDANKTFEQENKSFSSNIKEKEQKIQELQKEYESVDQDLKRVVISSAEKEAAMLDEALKTSQAQKTLELEEKNQIIANLEKEVKSLQMEMEFQGKSLVQSKQVALQLEASLIETKSEMQEQKRLLGKEQSYSESLLEELESHKQALLENLMKASIDRESLLAQFEGIYEQIGAFCREDVELSHMLEKMLHHSEEDSETQRNLFSSDGFNAPISPSRKSNRVSFDERIPLTELNC